MARPSTRHSATNHSTQAKDLMIPRTVVIPVGGQVTYEIDPFHRVNVYRAGTAPSDIDVSKLIDFVAVGSDLGLFRAATQAARDRYSEPS